jgi:hypothetical protein
MADYDSAWKEVLDRFFALVLAFLFPEAHQDIDWTRDHVSVETELRKLLPEAEVGLKRVDKLVKVVRKGSGDEAFLHAEAQMVPEEDFDRRMYVYNRKAEEVYNSPVVSVAILGDDRVDWRPKRYHFELWGCTKTFKFVTVKLLKWRGKEAYLQKHANPFAVFLLAHLQTLATRHDEDQRAAWKERLMGNFVLRPLDNVDRAEWLRLVDWLMELPRERNKGVWESIYRLVREKEQGMPFISFFEEREQQAEQRGRNDGEKLGLLKGIRGALRLRLPEQEKALMARVEQVNDVDLLGRVLDAALAADLEQLNRLLS